ncbi:immunity 8 family protein [soil metagenome]
MRAQIKAILSPDVDLATFDPPDANDVSVFLQLLVGSAGGIGEESFQLTVMTPRALERELHKGALPLLGRHYVFVERWETSAVIGWLTESIQSIEGPTWHEVGEKVARIGWWEFEDYKE